MAHYAALDALLQALPALAEANSASLAGNPCSVSIALSDHPEILLSLDEQGTIHLLPAGSAAADCTLRGTEDALLAVANGRLSPAKALLLRKLTLAGDVRVLMRLISVFS